jgi:hypothetical protein
MWPAPRRIAYTSGQGREPHGRMGHRSLILILPLLLAVGWGGAAAGGSGGPSTSSSDFWQHKRAACQARITALEALAGDCHERKALLQRDKAYEALLVLAPEHAGARKSLRYQKDRKTGLWVQKGYRAPKDLEPEVAALALAQRAELDATYVDHIMELIDEHGEALGPASRKSELHELLATAPDVERIREALGFIAVERHGERVWERLTTVAALARRKSISETVKRARAALPAPERGAPRPSETEWGIEWRWMRSTDRVRVLGNTSEAEVGIIAQQAHLQWGILPELFGPRPQVPLDLTFYIVDAAAGKDALLASYPQLTDKKRELYAELVGAWFGTSPHIGCWADEQVNRIDASSRMLTSGYFARAFGIYGRQGWISEGFGMYVSQLICGTRLTFTVIDTRYVEPSRPNLEREIGDPAADWFDDALEVLAGAEPTRLVATVGKDPNKMTKGDLVLAYTLASYLIEGHGPETLEKVLRRIGGDDGVSSTLALEEVLRTTMPELQQDLARWIESVGAQDW